MLKCFRCQSVLDTRMVKSGIMAECSRCDLTFMTLGHLVTVADSTLVTNLWEFIQSFPHEPSPHACGRCYHAMSEIHVQHKDRPQSFHACPACYLVVLRREVRQAFEETHPDWVSRDHRRRRQALIQEMRETRKAYTGSVGQLYDQAVYLLTETPAKEYKVTLILGAAALLVSFFTILIPHRSVVALAFQAGNPSRGFEASVLLASLVHFDGIHLLGSLWALWLLGPRVERALGLFRYLAFIVSAALLSFLIGPCIPGAPSLPAAGLGPLLAALLGFHIRAYPHVKQGAFLARKAPEITLQWVAGILILLEFRGLAPGGITHSWFTFPYSLIGLIFGYQCAEVYCRQKHRLKRASETQALQLRRTDVVTGDSTRTFANIRSARF